MNNIIMNLVDVADKLDRKGFEKQAMFIDKITTNLNNIKTAQYVGVQGYWIRNERCWSNCYRIKRAKNPSLPAQEVWKNCQNEYVDSVNGNSETWDKYAGEDTDAIKKFAGQKIENKAKKIISAEDKTFRREVNEKIANGIDTPIAVYDTIVENLNKYAEATISNSSELLNLSKQLPKSETDIIKQLEVLSEQLIKEAQGFGGIGETFKGWGRGLKNLVTKQPKGTTDLENLLARLQNMIQEASSIMQDAQAIGASTSPYYSASIKQNDIKKNAQSASTVRQDLREFYQKVLQERAYIVKQINMVEATGGLSSRMMDKLKGAISLIDALTKAYPVMEQKLNMGDASVVANGMRSFTNRMSRTIAGMPAPPVTQQQTSPKATEQTIPASQETTGVVGPDSIPGGQMMPETEGTSKKGTLPASGTTTKTISAQELQRLVEETNSAARTPEDALMKLLERLGITVTE